MKTKDFFLVQPDRVVLSPALFVETTTIVSFGVTEPIWLQE